MSTIDFRSELRDFIAAELMDGEQLQDDENLLVDGMLDSLGMMRLVAHMEALSGIVVPVEDFVIENFRTIATIDDYLRRVGAKRSSAPGTA